MIVVCAVDTFQWRAWPQYVFAEYKFSLENYGENDIGKLCGGANCRLQMAPQFL